MYQQMNIFDFLKPQESEKEKVKRLCVGDYIGKLVLGEVRKGKITKVEGNDDYFFYRTDNGTFERYDRTDFDQMEVEAAEIRKKYITVEIDHFDKFFAVEYPPRFVDGAIRYAMTGVYNGMLFWKKNVTYQFLQPEKDIEKAYKKMCFEITHESWGEHKEVPHKVLDKPIPTNRLYWSRHGFYSEAEYVATNG